MHGLSTQWGSDTVIVAADNWANAASQVCTMGEDGWLPTGCQVADYRHSAAAALRAELRDRAALDSLDAAETARCIRTAMAGAVEYSA